MVAIAEYPNATVVPSETRVSMLVVRCRAASSAPR